MLNNKKLNDDTNHRYSQGFACMFSYIRFSVISQKICNYDTCVYNKQIWVIVFKVGREWSEERRINLLPSSLPTISSKSSQRLPPSISNIIASINPSCNMAFCLLYYYYKEISLLPVPLYLYRHYHHCSPISGQFFSVTPYTAHTLYSNLKAQTTVLFLHLAIQEILRTERENVIALAACGG